MEAQEGLEKAKDDEKVSNMAVAGLINSSKELMSEGELDDFLLDIQKDTRDGNQEPDLLSSADLSADMNLARRRSTLAKSQTFN